MQVVCEQMLNNVFFKVKCLFCHRLSGALMLGQYLMYAFLLTMFLNLSSHNFMISMCGRIRKWNQLNLTATHWFNASTFFRQSFCNLLVSCSEKTVGRTLSLTFGRASAIDTLHVRGIMDYFRTKVGECLLLLQIYFTIHMTT